MGILGSGWTERKYVPIWLILLVESKKLGTIGTFIFALAEKRA